MNLLDTRITVVRPISDLAEEEWVFILIDTRMKCVGYAYHVRASKRHKWTSRRLWNWYSERESFDQDANGHRVKFNEENLPWSDELVTEAKRIFLSKIDAQVTLATKPGGHLS